MVADPPAATERLEADGAVKSTAELGPMLSETTPVVSSPPEEL